jgi:phosphopentomutase
MKEKSRVIVIVMDSVGVGAMPDATKFGDEGSNTLGHVAECTGGLMLPTLQEMGLGNIIPIKGVPAERETTASYGKMSEASNSKDTIAGHWEIMGLIVKEAFPTFPKGFPEEILEKFYQATGYSKIYGNKAASGTEIIKELGLIHMRTGFPIVYTSADSVFQIAAHEQVIPVSKLYQICEQARQVCNEYRIGRVIARPFIGKKGNFTRTTNRKDFPIIPTRKTVLEFLKENNVPVIAIGKIEDIFAGQGITKAIHTTSNKHGMQCLEAELSSTKTGLIFINLVDFDMLYGHRNDVKGYAQALEDFDRNLKELLPLLSNDDLLILTADHGCDPTHPGTDHTREYVPLLVHSKKLKPRPLGTRQSFADIGVSILHLFEIPHSFPGTPFI